MHSVTLLVHCGTHYRVADNIMIKKIFYFFLFLTVAAVSAAGGALYYFIVVDPGEEIQPSNIKAILGKESPVFYNDNSTKLGVFFDRAHRQYVRYEEIPPYFVNALVAAEDNRFFSHFGFDVQGITRAAIKNFQARRVVQGGSTLTQQTAKNLFKRTERSLKEKAKELLFALRLEYHYSKEQIFEFYANQFYVSGNGHGLGIAARYYFDKMPGELNLVECAFIAGSVKRPNYYNPFTKKGEEAINLAKRRGKVRQHYVLKKMLALQMIDQSQYDQAIDSEIGFKKGQVGYSLDYVMEMVKDAVSSTEVMGALKEHGVDNIATSGIRIITTVEQDIQVRSLHALRHELSGLDVLLRGYEREEVQQEYSELEYKGDTKLSDHAFIFGTVKEVRNEEKKYEIDVELDYKLGTAMIDYEGLKHLVENRVKFHNNKKAKPKEKDYASLVEQLQVEDRVWVSIRKVPEGETPLLTLEKYPTVQGGALVVKDGTIRAMAGGTENRYYNRAVYARRTMGSSFKPFVFSAALQLGWNASDLLTNTRDVFVYHNEPYYPRPDHVSPYDQVSMSWAGVHSENVASVWLLTHLCDKLSPSQFKETASYLGLAPRTVDGDVEPYRAYRNRIRDKYGIVVNRERILAAAYRAAVKNSEADFIFENMMQEYEVFKALPYGLNFDKYSEQISDQLKNKKLKLKAYERRELRFRKQLLSKNYLHLKWLKQKLNEYRNAVEDPLGFFSITSATQDSETDLFYDGTKGRYVFLKESMSGSSKAELARINRVLLHEQLIQMNNGERELFWEQVVLGGVTAVAPFDLLTRQITFEHKRLQRKLPYSFDVLSEIQDFRIYVGLKYLIALGREMGIESRLAPVLSFPLGSNVVTLLEATRMYEGLVTGTLTTYGENPLNGSKTSLLIIDRIESEDGEILYQPVRHDKNVLGKKGRIGIGHILENIVKFGTGRRARVVRLSEDSENHAAIRELDLPVPLLGKTGTANRYTNASFFGYLPGVTDKSDQMMAENGYAVGVYVGFDDNSPMRVSDIRVSGSRGALPTWIGIVSELIGQKEYAGSFDPVELSFSGLYLKRDAAGQLNLAADASNGGTLKEPAKKIQDAQRRSPSILTFGKIGPDGGFIPEPNFEPFWKVKQPVQ